MTAIITEVLTDNPHLILGAAGSVHCKVSGLIELINQCFETDGYVDIKSASDAWVVDTAVQLTVIDHETIALRKVGSAAVVQTGMRLHPCPPHITVFHHRRERAPRAGRSRLISYDIDRLGMFLAIDSNL